jgi:nitrogen PTS system EIIA component
VAPPWSSFDDTIGGLAALLTANGMLISGSETAAVSAVRARETEASTALLDIGVGVPHARLAGLAESVVALALSTRGLYEAVPTVPIHLAALVLSPPSASRDHLEILASVATLLRSATLRSALLSAADGPSALAVLEQAARTAP